MKTPRRKISASLSARLRRTARYRCGYCLTDETLRGMLLEIEHIIPLAGGGTNEETNLWPACRRCNGFKGSNTQAQDAATGLVALLFNPRTQNWPEHFAWNGVFLTGLTAVGRTTIRVLEINAEDRILSRLAWL